MRKVLFMVTLFVFILTSQLWAADISGNWTLKMSGRQGEVSMDMAIKAAGENLTITAKHPTMGDMNGTGTLKGNAITMNLTSTGERKMEVEFKGTVSGNKMSGTREFKMSAGGQGGAPGGQAGQGGAPGGQAGQGGAPGGQAGQGGAPGGQAGQGGAPGGQAGQGGAPGGQAGQGGAPGGQAGGQATSNAWTAEKK
jgi:hypothetical protein